MSLVQLLKWQLMILLGLQGVLQVVLHSEGCRNRGKGSEAIKQNRPLNAGATKKANVMGFEAEIPKVASSPDIGKALKGLHKICK